MLPSIRIEDLQELPKVLDGAILDVLIGILQDLVQDGDQLFFGPLRSQDDSNLVKTTSQRFPDALVTDLEQLLEQFLHLGPLFGSVRLQHSREIE